MGGTVAMQAHSSFVDSSEQADGKKSQGKDSGAAEGKT